MKTNQSSASLPERRNVSRVAGVVIGAATLLVLQQSASAIVYRDDITSATTAGLATQAQFSGVGQVVNGSANEYGTGDLILSDWVLTAKHVVTGYTTATFKGVSGTVYTDPNSDLALIHLSQSVAGATIAPGFAGGESGNLVWLVGLGGHGNVSQSANGGANLTYDASLHAGTNVVRQYANGYLYFDNADTASTSSVYESSTAPGDSGGPMFQQVNNVWTVVGATFSADNNGFYDTPTNPQKSFILSTIGTEKGNPNFTFTTTPGPTALTWDSDATTAGASDGSGTWDIQRSNFFSATTGYNYGWDNSMNNDVTFGNAAGAAGTVTIVATNVSSGTNIDGTIGPSYTAAGVTAHDVTFNAAASGTYTIAGTAPLTVVNTSAGDPVFTANVNAAISAPVASTAATITKAGSGTLVLSGANTFSSKLLVTAGTLEAQVPGALPNYAVANNTSVSSGATLAVNVGGASEWNSTQLTAVSTAATFSAGSSLGVDTTDGAFTHANVLAGTFGLTKLGANTFTSTVANTYAGATTVSAGTLKFTSAAGLPATSSTSVANGATLELDSYGAAATLANPLTLNGAGVSGSRGALYFNNGNIATFNLTGGINLAGSTTIGSYAVSTTLNFTSAITGTGNLSFNDEGGKVNSHTFTANFNAANNYVGNTNFSSGNGNEATFRIGVDNALPTGTVVTMTPAAGNLTFDLNGHAQTIAGLSSSGTVANAAITGIAGSALTVNNASPYTYAGQITGSVGLTKTGIGTQTLSGANTYTGATTINTSTLLLTGTLGNTAVTVNANGILAGTGTVAGSVTGTGTLAPGNGGAGTLGVGSLSLLSGVDLSYDLGTATGSDLLSTTTLDLNHNVTLAVTAGSAFGANGIYSLIDYTGSLTDASNGFSGWAATGLPAGTKYAFALGTDAATGAASVNLRLGTAVPEPTAASLLILGSGFVLRRRRNRK